MIGKKGKKARGQGGKKARGQGGKRAKGQGGFSKAEGGKRKVTTKNAK